MNNFIAHDEYATGFGDQKLENHSFLYFSMVMSWTFMLLQCCFTILFVTKNIFCTNGTKSKDSRQPPTNGNLNELECRIYFGCWLHRSEKSSEISVRILSYPSKRFDSPDECLAGQLPERKPQTGKSKQRNLPNAQKVDCLHLKFQTHVWMMPDLMVRFGKKCHPTKSEMHKTSAPLRCYPPN